MPAYGLNNASIPIISYNYGANHPNRIRSTIRWALIDSMVIMGIGVILLEGWTTSIVSIFAVSKSTTALCVWALRVIVWGFFFAGANIILQGVCQALGNGKYSLIISLIRFILIPLPFAYLIHSQQNVWFAIPLGEATGTIVAILLTKHIYKESVGMYE